jgi:hypothetical protein
VFNFFPSRCFRSCVAVWMGVLAAGMAVPVHAQQSDDAYPTPSAYPVSWELTFTHSDPKRIVVTLPGEAAPQAFWYITYKVVNQGVQSVVVDPDRVKERIFYPSFVMQTEAGKLLQGNDGIHPAVFDAIKEVERNKYLHEPVLAGGKILIGEDQTQESVAIWPETSDRMGSFAIFATGMWGETATAKDSQGNVLKDAKGEPILLEKTLMIRYHVDGDETHAGTVRTVVEKFVMR